MIALHRAILAVSLMVLAVVPAVFAGDPDQSTSPAPIHYSVSLKNPAQHLLTVTVNLPPGPSSRDMQLPVWNALYQVRDFSQYINWERASSVSGSPLPVQQLDKTTWRVQGTAGGAVFAYEISAQLPGPYGAEFNREHAFFNLAEILTYPTDARHVPVEVAFSNVPSGWRIATALTASGPATFSAPDYDRLVDGPVEIGTFRDAVFEKGGARYRVVVDAQPADYDLQKIVSMDERIVTAATSWMNDRPYDHYVFFYHFPRTVGGGGMEHAFSTSIQLNARYVNNNPDYLQNVSAHEFFHLWNVKRIRPQSLEPIDYTRENYTPSLWFSEGFTSTVAPYILLRAGLLDEPRFLQEISDQITALESRPAHLTESAVDSSLNAWLEKYPYYALPARSISYYNKGELLGLMLDLEIRQATHGKQSLRDMFQWMNEHYARQGKFFPDTQGVRDAAEAVAHEDLSWFFDKYVNGLDEIPYDRFLSTAGLRALRVTRTVADPGFEIVRSFEGIPSVGSVVPGSAAETAGLAAGDVIQTMNNAPLDAEAENPLSLLRPGDVVVLSIKNPSGSRELSWKIASRQTVEFVVKDMDNVSPQQRARRAAWLGGEDELAGDTRP